MNFGSSKEDRTRNPLMPIFKVKKVTDKMIFKDSKKAVSTNC